ncbi:MAG: PEP-CTERM sorting domain-containing protein [Verrucomicrobiaceae bacterium]
MNQSLTLISALLPLALSPLQATVTFQSLSGSTGTSFVTGPDAIIFPDESIAVQLRTDNQHWRLDDLDIKWGAPFGFGFSPVEVELITAGSPYGGGSTTSTPLVSANTSPANTTVNYTPGSTITLAPLTDFWIYLHVPAGDGDYAVTTTPNNQASGLWTIQEVQARQSGVVVGSLSNAPQILINATAVPEPSTSLLPLLALGLFLGKRRR